MKKLNKALLALVPALITFASTMVQSNACSIVFGEPEIPKALRK
ncbi:AgrD family cyclic lactone autoinducer peptide [Paramaledivibacter caminithermalis]|jgi:cyclic lactone autoinducer peptide|uniref:Cyclic lactone autoinducer peptide n=1 Tax=Paramaledivibacter caminithermalis (strain DSM 15212 / CIP 107654 / DViRD3) TaxID=1121301 RepID=A0A1M6LDE9_PARC5|nr:cyclic lactone autoinducer peptide [Paramaledivibacter caminithermalis]SHJ69233.1 cyclic lactone autoinducer peptide [Paramaledivibacter caminithermalis DSM 15212]